MLHTMGFNEGVEKVIVIIGGPEPLANAILRLVSQLDLTGLAIIFELGRMLRNMVGRCPTVFGEQEMQAIPRVFLTAMLQRGRRAPRERGATDDASDDAQDGRAEVRMRAATTEPPAARPVTPS